MCAVLGSSRLNSSAVSPTPGPCDRPIHLRRHCGDLLVAADTLEAATHLQLDKPPKQASRTSAAWVSIGARRACLVRSKSSQCHAKPHKIPLFTTSAPSLTPIRTWRPGPPDSTTLSRFRPRESLPCLPCLGRNLRMSASSYLDRRRADPSRAHRAPATQTSWMPHRSL